MTQTPDDILQLLKEGNARFLNAETALSAKDSLSKLKDYAENGQQPKAIVLCCSDSRAPVELIFDQDIGDLFVIRVAGNIVAPSLVGSVEFAASTFGTNLVLVMGHSGCGAVKATLDNIEAPQAISSENLHDIVSRIKPHIYQIAQIDEIDYSEKLERSVEANVLASVSQLKSASRLIEDLSKSGDLKIVGAVLELESGEVSFLDV